MVIDGFSADEYNMLLSTFKTEIETQVNQISRNLLDLEKKSEDEWPLLLQQSMREAHNLKGSAKIVDFDEVAGIAQHFESVLAAIRDKQLRPGPDMFDVLHRALDEMIAAVDRRVAGERHDVSAVVNSLLAALEQKTSGEPGPARPQHVFISNSTETVAAKETLAESTADERTAEHSVNDDKAAAYKDTVTSKRGDKGQESIHLEENVFISTRKLDELLDLIGELSSTKMRQVNHIERLSDYSRSLDMTMRARENVKTLGRSILKQNPDHKLKTITEAALDMQLQLQAINLFLKDMVRDTTRDMRTMSRVVEFIQARIKRTRMLPIATVFDGFRKMVREFSRHHTKAIELIVEGRDVELDKQMIEKIRDPLMHLIRNACDHGIEQPQQRAAQGKTETGTILLRAEQRGNSVDITITDDGHGIDVETLKEALIARGLLTVEQAMKLDTPQTLAWLFKPGFSTRQTVTDISGRGVGLDVVKHNIEQLHGTVELSTVTGRSTTFSLRIPLTLATVRVLLVEVSGELFGVPSQTVDKIIKVTRNMIETIEGRDVVRVDARPLPLYRLQKIIGLPGSSMVFDKAGFCYCLQMSSSSGAALFTIDAMVGEQDIVMKKLAETEVMIPCVSGGAILISGRVLIILNPIDILTRAQSTQSESMVLTTDTTTSIKKILLIDDSITTRNFLKLVLMGAGYDVLVASNGLEGLEVLGKVKVDGVMSDIQMPEMDGISFTERVRMNDQLKSLPIILVSSLDQKEDIARGLEAGADAYITKSGFDRRTILETLERLL